MAKADITIEAVIHKELQNLAETVNKRFGLRINSVDFEWLEVVPVGKATNAILLDVTMTTKKSAS